MRTVFTSITANYLPKARVLAASLRRHEPQVQVAVMLLDTIPPRRLDHLAGFDRVLTLADLDIPDVGRWLFKHTLVEACTAVKPFALRRLLDDGASGVVYLDPDIAVFQPLTEVWQRLYRSGVTLTPHVSIPETTESGIRDNELAALRHGVFNLGFLGVANSEFGRSFADWWRDRTYRYCYDDIPNGIFTDQKWVDLAPVYFRGLDVLDGPEFNVSTWNYSTRRLAGTAPNEVTVNGRPLVFHHFSGVDSGAHATMRDKYGAHMPVAIELSEWYAEQCNRAGQGELGATPWTWDIYRDGAAILRGHRLLYRSRRDLAERFPDPFAGRGERESYASWLEEQGLWDAPSVSAVPFDAFIADTARRISSYLSGTERLVPWQKRLSIAAVSRAARLAAWMTQRPN